MARLPNPYTPGQPAKVLGGRAGERARVSERLDRVGSLGEYGGPLLVFHSPRGIGKTSLLRLAQRDASDAGFLTVWASASGGSSVLAELVYATRAAITSASFISDKLKAIWTAHVSSLELQLGLPGAGAKATVETTKNQPPDLPGLTATPAEAPISALAELWHSGAVLVRKCGGSGLVVFVDEVHASGRTGLGIVLNALQNLDGAPKDTALTAVFAGLPNSPDVITDAATFGERSQFVALGRLDQAGSGVALAKPATDSGVAWEAEALGRVVSDASGYPYFIQLLGSTTWDAAEPGPGSTLTLDHVQTGYPHAIDQLTAMFQARWNIASGIDKEFIVAMVELMIETSADDIDRASIAGRMGKTSGDLSVPRDRLMAKGIIEPSGHGLLRFTIPGFAAYVARESGSGSVAELQSLAEFLQLGGSES